MKTLNFLFKNLLYASLLVGIILLVSINNASAFEEITVFTNQKTYFLRDTVEIRGDIHTLSNEDLVKIKIIDPGNQTVFEIVEKIDREDRDYEYKFTLLMSSLVKGIYTVNVTYEEKEATTTFLLFPSQADQKLLSSSISLDKDIYSWTETVEIFVYAPSYNRNNQVEYIGFGSELEGKIEIKTGMGKLENYRLIETENDSGLFHGKITLAGDATIDANGNKRKDDASGILSGSYPFDGKIPARNNDVIKVTFSDESQEIEKTSKVSWTVAKMGWVKKDDSKISLLRVLDKDMDLNPERRDFIFIYDPSHRSVGEIRLIETDISTGVFEGHTSISYPVYYDRTFPNSKSSSDFLEIITGPLFDESIESPSNLPRDKESTGSLKLKMHIPSWVKITAGWWGQDSISEPDFINTLQYLIKEQIIVIEDLGEPGKWEDNDVSRWTKGYAKMWSKGVVPDEEFVKGIQHIVEQGLIQVR